MCVAARYMTLFSVIETREGQFACRLATFFLCPIVTGLF
ncbi:hypothetical protein EPIB1_170 [Tritonibacter mobilis]|nr:hypothetical protein EPIB1_170 [Tritonibacter mobilis]